MKASVVLLALSLAANVALIAAISIQPALVPQGVRDYFQRTPLSAASPADIAARESGRRAAAEHAAAKKSGTPDAAIDRRQLWAAIDSDDLPTLVKRLRAAGFSRSVVLALINAKLDARYADRFKALTGDIENLPFWKPDPTNSAYNRSFFEQYSQLYRERSKVVRDLLGDDAMAWPGTDPSVAKRRQFGSIPKEKIDLIQRINDDYAEMTSQVRLAMQGITLPEDREKLALLEREKRADLAAILTPAELEEYEMRTSNITGRLRAALTLLDSSAEEFRTIFKIHQQFNDRINPPAGITSGMMDSRREAQQQMNAQLQAALGPARYADYTRASNPEFQQLYRIAQNENIPMDATVRAFGVRDQIAAESTRIFDDASMSRDQKRTALEDLAKKARVQISSTLGVKAGEAYTQVATRWLGYLERGMSFSIGPDGNPTMRGFPAPLPPGR